jgi:hypothetical protein
LKKLSCNTSVVYSNLENRKTAYSINQILQLKGLSIFAVIEQFNIDGKKFRTAWSGGLDYHGKLLDTGGSTWLLDGDSALYPAYVYKGYIMKKIWLSDLLLKPVYSFSFSRYPRFNAYQNELSLNLVYKRTSFDNTVVRVQRDAEEIGGDNSWWAYHTDFGYLFNNGIIGYVSAGIGKQDWWVSPYGNIIDTDISYHFYAGNSIWLPLAKKTYLIYYQQIGIKQSIWHYTGSLKLSFSY